MKSLFLYWRVVRGSLWFMPAVVILGYSLAALLLISIDSFLANRDWQPPAYLLHGADAAREMLTTIASSTITVAGVTFSITIVTLSLAASNYTSRILRHFMADIMNQVVLGGFVGLYLYCLLVLRTVRSSDEGYFVPYLAAAFAFVLAIVGISLLIAFIHHTALSIQASTIISSIASDTIRVIERLYPNRLGQRSIPSQSMYGSYQNTQGSASSEYPKEIRSLKCGYIQAVNIGQLVEESDEFGIRLTLHRRIGQFVVEGDTIIRYDGNTLSSEKQASLLGALQLNNFRSIDQDAAFGIRQIVDIALKALSPGINDSTTAVTAVDHLSQVLTSLAARDLDYTPEQEPMSDRVHIPTLNFDQYVSRAYDEIRQFSTQNLSVSIRQIASLERVANAMTDVERLKPLEEQASAIRSAIGLQSLQPPDRESFQKYYDSLMRVISGARVTAAHRQLHNIDA